eukprot:2902645-Rhodomonas_salina.3
MNLCSRTLESQLGSGHANAVLRLQVDLAFMAHLQVQSSLPVTVACQCHGVPCASERSVVVHWHCTHRDWHWRQAGDFKFEFVLIQLESFQACRAASCQ